MPKNPALSSGLTVPNENIKIGHVTSFDPCIDYYEMFSKLYKDILSWYLIKLYVKKISERVARLEVYRQVPRLLPNAAIWKSVTHNCFVHDMLNLLFLLSEIKSIPRIMLFINQSQSVQGHCVHFALSKTRLCKLGPAPRRDVKSREIFKGAGPMIQTKPWVLLLLKFLWILHPSAEQDQAAPVGRGHMLTAKMTAQTPHPMTVLLNQH